MAPLRPVVLVVCAVVSALAAIIEEAPGTGTGADRRLLQDEEPKDAPPAGFDDDEFELPIETPAPAPKTAHDLLAGNLDDCTNVCY